MSSRDAEAWLFFRLVEHPYIIGAKNPGESAGLRWLGTTQTPNSSAHATVTWRRLGNGLGNRIKTLLRAPPGAFATDTAAPLSRPPRWRLLAPRCRLRAAFRWPRRRLCSITITTASVTPPVRRRGLLHPPVPPSHCVRPGARRGRLGRCCVAIYTVSYAFASAPSTIAPSRRAIATAPDIDPCVLLLPSSRKLREAVIPDVYKPLLCSQLCSPDIRSRQTS